MTLSSLHWPGRVNLCLVLLYPAAWFAPLATAGVLPWFSGDTITVIKGVQDLWAVDMALALLVLGFAVVLPFVKTLALMAIHFGVLGKKSLPVLEVLGKLSMADVFLIALYIVVVKGVGIGHVTPAWGLWLFTACVLASIWVAWATNRQMRSIPEPAGAPECR